MWYDNLKNRRLWENFQGISEIPRQSGNEAALREYLLKWAKEHDIEAEADKAGNVIMRVKATEGKEDVPSIALQGHMDMVCVKTADSTHDFDKDPIEIVRDGEYIRAKDTSLGADDGIALAIAMDIFSDPDAVHGPLEGIFTVAEETGLTGANGLDASLIRSRKLINIDSEEDGIIYNGCAGGIDIRCTMRIRTSEVPEGYPLHVKVSGLLGGHSGSDIHKERANAISVLARYLSRLPGYQLAWLEGGTKRNVIPSEASALIVVQDREIAMSILSTLQEELSAEYRYRDPDIRIEAEDGEMPGAVMTRKKSAEIADALFTVYHGVAGMNPCYSGVVETSDNLAIAHIDAEKAEVELSVRSSRDSAKNSLAYRISALMESFGFTVRTDEGYPAWEPDPESSFTREIAECYERLTGRKPEVTVIHAGLECGIINSIIDGMDSVSIGPELKDIHSVNERANIESCERVSDFVKKFLAEYR